LLFLVDAQLPPLLAEALRQAGCEAVHVIDLGLQAATDEQIWDEAISRSAVLVTKDRDFALRRAATNDGPAILWVRVGNTSNRKLIELVLRALPAIVTAIERDEAVIEFIGR
jgi:predicted nuclease of predicted toxin-antitoxin system